MSVLKKLKEKYEKKGAVIDTLPKDGFFVHLNSPIKRPGEGKITENLTAKKEDNSGYIHIHAKGDEEPLAAVNSSVMEPPHSIIVFYDCKRNKKWLPELIGYLDSLEQ